MNIKHIEIRAAGIDDAPIIAAALIMGIGDESLPLYCGTGCREIFEELARMEVSQYSYHNALMAEADGIPAGAAIGYDGAMLGELRQRTFEVIRMRTGKIPHVGDETEAGEFYLDTIGVLPEFRGCGIGKHLLAATLDRAFDKGHGRVGLLVDFKNIRAERLYIALGFKYAGVKFFLGHKMRHLQYDRQ